MAYNHRQSAYATPATPVPPPPPPAGGGGGGWGAPALPPPGQGMAPPPPSAYSMPVPTPAGNPYTSQASVHAAPPSSSQWLAPPPPPVPLAVGPTGAEQEAMRVEQERQRRQHALVQHEEARKRQRSKDKAREEERLKKEQQLQKVAPETHPERAANLKQKNAKFVGRFKFKNTLPPLPAQAKMLPYPLDNKRWYVYNTSSLESSHKFSLLSEPDLGIPIDLVNPEAYVAPTNQLQPEDASILQHGDKTVNRGLRTLKKEALRPRVAWLRRTEYMSNDLWDPTYKAGENDDIRDFDTGAKLDELGADENDIDADRDRQIQMVEKTFEDAKLAPRHPTKPHLKAVKIRPIFPDFEHWPDDYVHVIYDTKLRTSTENAEEGGDSTDVSTGTVLRNFKVPSGPEGSLEHYLGLLAPKKRARENEAGGSENEFIWEREYTFNVSTAARSGKPTSFLLNFDDDKVCYNVFERRLKLHKKKAKVSHGHAVYQRPSKVTLEHRNLSDEETRVRQKSLSKLYAEGEEEEEEEEAEVEEGDGEGGDTKAPADEEEAADIGGTQPTSQPMSQE